MNNNNRILKELVNNVRELRKINLDQKKMNHNFEKRLQLEYALLSEQREELKLLKEWLANHEVRLRSLEA